MSKHTKEPWQFYQPCEHPRDFRIAVLESDCEDNGNSGYIGRLTKSHGMGAGSKHPKREDAARIVACVNAFAGIPDPARFVAAARELAKAAETCDDGACLGTNGIDYSPVYGKDFDEKLVASALKAFRAADAPS